MKIRKSARTAVVTGMVTVMTISGGGLAGASAVMRSLEVPPKEGVTVAEAQDDVLKRMSCVGANTASLRTDVSGQARGWNVYARPGMTPTKGIQGLIFGDTGVFVSYVPEKAKEDKSRQSFDLFKDEDGMYLNARNAPVYWQWMVGNRDETIDWYDRAMNHAADLAEKDDCYAGFDGVENELGDHPEARLKRMRSAKEVVSGAFDEAQSIMDAAYGPGAEKGTLEKNPPEVSVEDLAALRSLYNSMQRFWTAVRVASGQWGTFQYSLTGYDVARLVASVDREKAVNKKLDVVVDRGDPMNKRREKETFRDTATIRFIPLDKRWADQKFRLGDGYGADQLSGEEIEEIRHLRDSRGPEDPELMLSPGLEEDILSHEIAH